MTNELCDKEKCNLLDSKSLSSSSCKSDVSDDDDNSKISCNSHDVNSDLCNYDFNLPASSQDLLVPNEYLMDCLSLYEILRRFSNVLRLSGFLFEDFCSCLLSEDASVMLCEIHITLLKAIQKDNEESGVCFVHNDLKSSFDILFFAVDYVTWPSILKMYLSANFAPVEILNIFHEGFPFVDLKKKISVLRYLTDSFLTVSSVRKSLSLENVQEQKYDDHCRVCHKRGDLLCCDGCTATFHMYCLNPPIQSVPKEQWYCPVCVKSKVHGVTDCGIVANDSKSLRLELIGYDRCYRSYWFLCRRIFVESESSDLWYYSTVAQYQQLIDVLEKTGHKRNLLSVFRSFEGEILREMEITIELTDDRKSGKQSYFDIQKLFCENITNNDNEDFDETGEFEDSESIIKEDKNDAVVRDDDCFFAFDDPSTGDNSLLRSQLDGVNDESPPVIKVLNLNPGNFQEPVISTFNLQWLLNQSSSPDVSTATNTLDLNNLLITSADQCDSTNTFNAESLFPSPHMMMNEQKLVYDEPVQMNMCTPLSVPCSRKEELRTERQSSGVRIFTIASMPPTSTPVISNVPQNFSLPRTTAGSMKQAAECLPISDSLEDASISSETSDTDKSDFDFPSSFDCNAAILPKKVFVPLTHPLAEESIKGSSVVRGKRRGRPPLTYRNITVKIPESQCNEFDANEFMAVESQTGPRGRGRGRPSSKRGSRRARSRILMNFNDRRSTRSSTGSLKPRVLDDNFDETMQYNRSSVSLSKSIDKMSLNARNDDFENMDFSFSCSSTSVTDSEADLLLDLDFSKSFLKLLKFLRVKPPSDESEDHKSLYDFYVLGDDSVFKEYRNTYANNPLAVPKAVVAYERERKNILARRYTVNSDLEFVWKLPITGSLNSYMQNIRLSLLNFECCIPTPFMHSLWHTERLKWANEVLNCLEPEQFGILLLKLEAAVKPFIFNPSYFDGIAAVAWRRETQQEREDKRKDDHQNKKRIDSEIAACTCIPKMTRPCLWRMKGEEYRILGGGWLWIRSTRKFLLRNRVIKHMKLSDQWPLLTRLNITAILNLLRRRCVVSEMLDPVTGKLSCIKFNNDGESCYEVTEADLLDGNGIFKGIHPLLEQIDVATVEVDKSLVDRVLYPKRAAKSALDSLLQRRTMLQSTLKSQLDASLLSLRERVKQDLFSARAKNDFSSNAETDVEARAEETMRALIGSGRREGDGTVVVKYKNDYFKIPFNIDDTRLPFNMTKFHCFKKKQTQPQLPPYMSFEKNKKRNFFILPFHIVKRLAKRAGDVEVPGFKDSRHIVWPFPCGKPVQRTVWCWRTRTANTLAAIALQTKLLWFSIRWDALCKRDNDDTKNPSIEIIKKRDIGKFGLRSEYLIKKTVHSEPNGRGKPNVSSCVKEEWVPEESLEPLEIYHFYEQQQRKLRLFRAKIKQTSLSQHALPPPVVNDVNTSKETETEFSKFAESCHKVRIASSHNQTVSPKPPLQNIAPMPVHSVVTQPPLVSIESSITRLIPSNSVSNLSNLNLVSGVSESLTCSPLVQPPVYKVIQNVNGKLSKPEGTRHFEPRVLRLVDGRLTCVRNLSSSNPIVPVPRHSSETSESTTNNTVSYTKVVQSFDSHLPTITKVVVEPHPKFEKALEMKNQSMTNESKRIDECITPQGLRLAPTIKGDILKLQLQPLEKKVIAESEVLKPKPKLMPKKIKVDEKTKTDALKFLKGRSELLRKKTKIPQAENSTSLHPRFSVRRKIDREESKLLAVCTSVINGITLEVDRMEKKLRRAKNRVKRNESMQRTLSDEHQINPPKSEDTVDFISKANLLQIRMKRIQHDMIQTLKIAEIVAKESCDKLHREARAFSNPCSPKRHARSSKSRSIKRSTTDSKSSAAEDVLSDTLSSHMFSSNRPVRKRKCRKVSFSPDPFNNRVSSRAAKRSRLKSDSSNKRSGSRIKKPKWMSGNERRKQKFGPENSDLLFCSCRTPYDKKEFYVGCELCGNWFHGKCIGISANMAQDIDKYICIECSKKTDTERVYCLCQAPYDETQFYVGCDKCQEWFHGSCVGVTPEEAENMKKYFCPRCCNDEINILEAPLSRKQWDLVKDLFRSLKSHPMAWPFLAPVSVKEFPLYYEVISDPMDIGTLEGRLMKGQYKCLGEFVRDTTKIFDNCRMFNSVESIFWRCADALEHFFVGLLNKLKATLLQQIKDRT